ncbi:MAG: hypothetical protein ACKO5M_08290, partial [Vulcanococcus sp.]
HHAEQQGRLRRVMPLWAPPVEPLRHQGGRQAGAAQPLEGLQIPLQQLARGRLPGVAPRPQAALTL